MMRPSPLLELYKARLREFYRQPARIFWVYGFPTILALGLGLAFSNRRPESLQVDVARGATSGPVEESLAAYNRSHAPDKPALILRVLPAPEAELRLDTGKTPLVVARDASGRITYKYDPARPESAATRAAVDDILQQAAGRRDPVPTVDDTERRPGARYIDFLIPGLIGLNTMGGGLWGIGFLLVNFRIGKLLKRLMATPMPRHDFLLALLGARLTFLIPDAGTLLLLGVFVFGMPIRGNFAAFVVLEVVGALAFAGIGLLVACRASTTETVSGLMNLVMLPMWLLSGVFFSSERFPAAMQPLIQALPLTQLVDGLREILLEGAGFAAVVPNLAILAAWAVATFVLALRLFKWT